MDNNQGDSYRTILIKKTFGQQKEDLLKTVYVDRAAGLTEICEQWKNVIELVVDPIGWNALWKLSREKCAELNISYPASVIVMVDNIDFSNLTATVSPVVVEDDASFPGSVSDVSLIHLFPTVEQDNDIPVDRIADIIHDLRVFYNYLWYPWDEEKLNEKGEWFSLHFENRLTLHYDIMMGKIQPKVYATINKLIKESRCLHKQIVELDQQLMHLDCNSPNQELTSYSENYLLISQLQLKLNQVTDELTFYERKDIRDMMARYELNKEDIDNRQFVSLAWCGGRPAEFMSVTKKLNELLPPDNDICFKSSDSLEKLITDVSQNENIYLAPSKYSLCSRTYFDKKCVITGIEKCNNNTSITDKEEGLCLLLVRFAGIHINNVHLSTSKSKYVILVNSGKCYLNNVKLNGDKRNTGISIHEGGQLVAENCDFRNYSTAIYAEKGSSVVLNNCTFDNNENGIKFQESSIEIDSCKFTNHKSFALLMESSSDTAFMKIDKGKSVLKDLEGVKLTNTSFHGNNSDMAKYY